MITKKNIRNYTKNDLLKLQKLFETNKMFLNK